MFPVFISSIVIMMLQLTATLAPYIPGLPNRAEQSWRSLSSLAHVSRHNHPADKTFMEGKQVHSGWASTPRFSNEPSQRCSEMLPEVSSEAVSHKQAENNHWCGENQDSCQRYQGLLPLEITQMLHRRQQAWFSNARH